MSRVVWALVLVVVLALCLATGRALWNAMAVRDTDVDTAESRLARQSSQNAVAQRGHQPNVSASSPDLPRGGVGAAAEDTGGLASLNVVAPAAPPATSTVTSRQPASVIQVVAGRFRRYLELTKAADRPEQSEQARELVQDLRAMGVAPASVLLDLLLTATDLEDRRAAARLLGALQAAEAVPAFKHILETGDDVVLRRDVAFGLQQLQTPDAIALMEQLVANSAEDNVVRLSAASGLAQMGRAEGVTVLTEIFQGATSDGRARAIAFRELSSLNDERTVPFMRQVVTSQVEPAYRLQAIRYLSAQGDRQALDALQTVIQSPTEQPSIRSAANLAYTVINGR